MSLVRLDTDRMGTLIVSGVVPLRKFDNIQFKVKSSDSDQYSIMAGSTVSLVVLGRFLSLQFIFFLILSLVRKVQLDLPT